MPYASVDRKRCACQSTCRASLARSCDRDSKSAVCIIFTRAKLPDRKKLPNARVRMKNEPCARSLWEVQFLVEGHQPLEVRSGTSLRRAPPTSLMTGQLSFWEGQLR